MTTPVTINLPASVMETSKGYLLDLNHVNTAIVELKIQGITIPKRKPMASRLEVRSPNGLWTYSPDLRAWLCRSNLNMPILFCMGDRIVRAYTDPIHWVGVDITGTVKMDFGIDFLSAMSWLEGCGFKSLGCYLWSSD